MTSDLGNQAARVDVDGVAMHVLTRAQTVSHVMSALDEGRGGLLLTANVDIMYQLHRDPGLDIARRADVVVADGMPVVWASRIQGGAVLPERVTGADLVWALSREAARRDRSVFLLGAAPGVAQRAGEVFVEHYPGLRIAGHLSPARGFEKDPEQLAQVVRQLEEAAPDLVFVALGFPKQEQVALVLREAMPATWFMGCGGALDMAAGEVKRAHPLVQLAGAEWLHRLGLEPRRLARRYLVHDMPYALGLMGRALARRLRRS